MLIAYNKKASMKKMMINKAVAALLSICFGTHGFAIAKNNMQDHEYFVHLSQREKELLADEQEEELAEKKENERIPFWFEFWKRHRTNQAAQDYKDKLSRSRQKHKAKNKRRQAREHEKDAKRLAQVVQGKNVLAEQKEITLGAAYKRHQLRKNLLKTCQSAQHKHNATVKDLDRYADLYVVPAWQKPIQFYENHMQAIFDVQYQYAEQCYNSASSDAYNNITKLAFGDQSIRIQDLLLASKLMRAGSVMVAGPFTYLSQTPADNYLHYFANEIVNFSGQMHRCQASIDLSKYFFNEQVLAGLRVPVVYGNNILRANMQCTDTLLGLPSAAIDANAIDFTHRYGGDVNRFLRDILHVKGFTRLGGKEIGLGDFSFYVSTAFQSRRFEKALLGLTLTVPTAKQPLTDVLWAPELGNGGFFQLGLDGAMLLHYNAAINPHGQVSITGFIPAQQKQRVPRKVDITGDARGARVATLLHGQTLAFADRISFNQLHEISDYDTTVRGFGDTVSLVRITKGPQLKIRLGNVFEHCLWHRCSLDIYYDLHIKARDAFGGFDRTIYNFSIMQENTDQIAHGIGGQYTYQHNHDMRLRLGTRYIFAGKNVPKLFELTGAVNYSF
jgi:hypothetical protein